MTSENELSERELEILELVATGASNKEIAQELVISPNTVKVHLRNIFAKIGASSRTEATMYAIRAGLIPAPVGVESFEDLEPEAVVVENAVQPPAENLPTDPAAAPSQRPSRRWAVAAALVLVAVILLALGSWLPGSGLFGNRPSAIAGASSAPVRLENWLELPSMPIAASGMAAARYENSIYLFGGETASGVTDEVRRYNLLSGEWQLIGDLPQPVADVQAALLGEKIYIPGGKLPGGELTNRLQVYDPRQDSWSEAAPLPLPLSAYALAPFEGQLYIFGGWDGSSFVDTVFAYQPEEDRWEQRHSLSQRRGYAAAVPVPGRIYLMGGTDGAVAMDLNQAYFPQREISGEDAWEDMAPLPQPRSAFAAVELADQIYVIGGAGDANGDLGAVQYQPQQNRWLQLQDAPHPLGASLAAARMDTRLHLFGGQSQGALLNHHTIYQAIFTVQLPVVQDAGGE